MITMKGVKRHPVISFYVLAFGLSWGMVLLATGPGRFQGQSPDANKILAALLGMLIGPFGSGLLMTALVDGRAGLRSLLTRLLHWRVGWKWYAAAILPNTLLVPTILFSMAALVSPDYLPGFRPIGVVFGLAAGIFEELGWTGFVIPKLLEKRSPLKAGLIHGFLWGIWHLWAGFLGSVPGYEGWWLLEAFTFWVGGLAAYRVLMTWVYSHTHSVLLGQIQHAFFTGIFYTFVTITDVPQSTKFYVVAAMGLWLIVAVLVGMYGRQLAGRKGRIQPAHVL